jgi:dTDP-4-amino-4,6-dideoxygalactose transaminase
MINLFHPYVPEEAISEASKVLSSRWIGQAGKVKQFEDSFCKLFGQKYAVSLNSGTSALETAYDLVGLSKGDEVISTPYTCTATNLMLLSRGVKIVWADVLPTTLNIDPYDVKRKMTDKTKAVVQVHVGGIMADVGRLRVPVISDAAQALGIFTGDYTCCSFQAIKHITTGDGGMIVLNNEREYNAAKLMRWFGIDREKKELNDWQCYKERKMTFDIEILGYKRHMNDIAASMGIVGLSHYGRVIDHRRNIFNIYREELDGIDGIKLIDGTVNTYWLATVLVERRDDFARKMFDNDIDVNMVHIRNDLYKIFGGKRADLPVLNSLEGKYICLPINMQVTEENARYICSIIRQGW